MILVCVNPFGDLELWEATVYDVYKTPTWGWLIIFGNHYINRTNVAPGNSIEFWGREVLSEL